MPETRGQIELTALVSCALCKKPFELCGQYQKDGHNYHITDRDGFTAVLRRNEMWEKYRFGWICKTCAIIIARHPKKVRDARPEFGRLILNAKVACANCDNTTTIWGEPYWDLPNVVNHLKETSWEHTPDGYVCDRCVRTAELRLETRSVIQALTSAA